MPTKKPAHSRATAKTSELGSKSGRRTKRAVSTRSQVGSRTASDRRGTSRSNVRLPAALFAGIAGLLVFGLFFGIQSSSVAPSPSATPTVANGGLWQAAVQVGWATRDSDGALSLCGGGSGGLVGKVDQVLTNEHVVNGSDNEGDCADASLYVGYPVEHTGTYFVWWPAKVKGSNEFLDLAVVDVNMNATADVDDTKYPASIVLDHDWPIYSLATEEPVLGDPVSIYSYPGIGGYSMTFTAGHVAGWSWDYWSQDDTKGYSEGWLAGFNADTDGYRDYMKLDATIAHGSSGSSVLNENGEVIGVTTLLGINYQGDAVDCLRMTDTNGDGNFDEKDVCTSVGGFLNASATLVDIRSFLVKLGVVTNP